MMAVISIVLLIYSAIMQVMQIIIAVTDKTIGGITCHYNRKFMVQYILGNGGKGNFSLRFISVNIYFGKDSISLKPYICNYNCYMSICCNTINTIKFMQFIPIMPQENHITSGFNRVNIHLHSPTCQAFIGCH